MKDSRFIELVNLYVDRQITAAEATELEAEMQAQPRRRAVYHQYCQMQKATTLVYESFRTNAPGQEAGVAPGHTTIARFEDREPRRRTHWSYYAGALAAACLALVLVQMNFNRPPDETKLAVTPPKTVPPAALVAVQPVPVVRAAVEARAGLVSLRNNPANEQDYAGMVAAVRLEEQRAFASNQTQSGRPPSLFEDGVFDTQPGVSASSQRTFRGKQAPAQQAEFTAFQFQR
jgi:hypothetical protein